jgi:hypothetical protein
MMSDITPKKTTAAVLLVLVEKEIVAKGSRQVAPMSMRLNARIVLSIWGSQLKRRTCPLGDAENGGKPRRWAETAMSVRELHGQRPEKIAIAYFAHIEDDAEAGECKSKVSSLCANLRRGGAGGLVGRGEIESL